MILEVNNFIIRSIDVHQPISDVNGPDMILVTTKRYYIMRPIDVHHHVAP